MMVEMRHTARLDRELVQRMLVATRSQAESYVKLGNVTVNRQIITKPGHVVRAEDDIRLTVEEQYVSRAGLKLASVAAVLGLDFRGKIVLDVGASTGGFTDYVLRRGAKKILAVDVGTNQLHTSLRGNAKVELHERTDIRDFHTDQPVDMAVVDVSFISLREVLPHIAGLLGASGYIVAMVKPQFEIGSAHKHKGVIKNDRIRRDVLKDFEIWAKERFVLVAKADSEVSGAKGNRERFYVLQIPRKV